MLKNLSFTILSNTIYDLWNTTKNYVTALQLNTKQEQENNEEQNHSSKETKMHSPIDFKRLLILGTVGLFSATRNQVGLSLGLATLFVDSVNAALPTVANPIPTQYAEIGQAWNYDVDLNQVFNDADGNEMLFGGAVIASGPSTNWLTAGPKMVFGRTYSASTTTKVILSDNLAFVFTGYSVDGFGVLIFDVSDPGNKKFLSSIIAINPVNGVFNKPYFYLSNSQVGLEIYNLTNVSRPALVNTYHPLQNRPKDITVVGSTLYLIDNYNRLEVLDVSNATNPIFLGNYSTTNSLYRFEVEQDLMYVAGTSFYVLNISNPSSIFLVNTQVLSTTASEGFFWKDQIAYLPLGLYGLTILNTSNVFNITTLLKDYDPLSGPNGYYDISIVNSVGYLIDGYSSNNRLLSLNLTNMSFPTVISEYIFPDAPNRIVAVGNVLYVACYGAGVQILNGSNPANLSVLNQDMPPYNPEQLAIKGDILTVADQLYGLQILNISDPINPVVLSNYYVSGILATDVAIQNSIAYLASYLAEGLTILDISNPMSPIRLSALNLGLYIESIVADNTMICLGDIVSGIYVFDTRNLSNPVDTGNYTFVERSQDVDLQDSILYIAGNGLLTVNVTNASEPILLGEYLKGTGFRAVTVAGNIVFTENGILNASNLKNLTKISSISTPGVIYDFFPMGPITLVADGGTGLSVLNTTDLAAPTYLGGYTYLRGTSFGVTAVGKYAYLAKEEAGLQIFDLSKMGLKNNAVINRAGNYTIRVSAVNANYEWISTTFQLEVCATSCPRPVIASTAMSSNGLSTTVPTPSPTPTPVVAINRPAVLQTNSLSLNTGSTVTLSSLNLNATDDSTSSSNLIFIVSQVSNGYFQTTTNPTVPIYSFTQQQVGSGNIQFVHDGSNTPPSYQVYVNDGSLNSLPQWAAVIFNGEAVPVLVTNQITINTGQTIILNSTNLHTTDADNNNPDNLIFTVTNVQHGFFANSSNPTVPITNFTQGDINAGTIQFIHDGSTNYPSYFVSVSDGTFTTPPSLVQINFNNNFVPIVLSNQLTISPGQSVTIGIENIGGIDLDSNSNNLIFTITDITGGQFELMNNPGVSINQFTLQDIINGNVVFTVDAVDCVNATSPSYSLQASDDSYSTLLSISSIEYNTETTTNGCIVTTTVTNDNTNLYIGVGVGVGVAALAATALGIFALKRKHQYEREVERTQEMESMAQAAAQYKNQPQTVNTEAQTEEGTLTKITYAPY